MHAEPDIPWTRFVAFVRQYTHDVRNGLNCLDLETALLKDSVIDDEGRASVERVRKQLHSLAGQLRSLSSLFQTPEPIAAPIAARELVLIWQDKHAAIPDAPEVRWVDELGDEKVNVDVEMIANVFSELLLNAAAFSQGETLAAAARVKGGRVVFELREPKKEPLDPTAWGEPFCSTRRGRHGLGLWAARRRVEANGGTLTMRYVPGENALLSQITFKIV